MKNHSVLSIVWSAILEVFTLKFIFIHFAIIGLICYLKREYYRFSDDIDTLFLLHLIIFTLLSASKMIKFISEYLIFTKKREEFF